MQKLITVNIETNKHYPRIIPFLNKENPDFLCMQEVPKSFAKELHNIGYYTTFAPRHNTILNETQEGLGVLFASKTTHQSKVVYYHGSETEARALTVPTSKEMSFPYIIASINTEHGNYTIATTHLAVTKDGRVDEFQSMLMDNLLQQLSTEASHCICGDFNMPRGFNTLYAKVIERYTDNIPPHYTSSLDKNLHRLGNQTLDEPIFEKYMVDYIFSQAPYQVSDVQLHFGVSDHAAVSAYITKTQ
jgi:endonuclease/exonuclease/phosphatase family metal-dependent hydrolase